jgi:hypothetical protein
VFSISMGTAGLATTFILAVTERAFAIETYVLILIGLFIILLLLNNVYVDPINRQFIRWFGGKRLESARIKVASIVVIGLYERREWELPLYDEDLLIREAALNFDEFLKEC